MMSSRNIHRWPPATVLHAGVACVVLLALAITPLRTFAIPQRSSIAKPDAQQVDDAFARARTWIDAFETPRMNDPASQAPIDRATAVCVILRRHGRVMGTGVDATGDALMLRRAVGRAMNQALSDPALQSLATDLQRGRQPEAAPPPSPPDGPNAPDDKSAPGATTKPLGPRIDPEAEARIARLRADLGRTMTLELEVAGENIPLVGRTLAQMSVKVDPGIDGVAVRRDGRWTHVFPSQQRVSNTLAEPERMLTSAALSAGMPMSELGATAGVGDRKDVSFYRFVTIDLAQARADDPPVELFRGSVLVRPDEVTRTRLAATADRLVDHLLTHQWPQPPAPLPGEQALPALPMGLRGDYSPAADQYLPSVAPPMEQALCAWSLMRYAQNEHIDRARAGKAAVAAREILRDLANVHAREMNPREDPGACAVLLYLAADSPSLIDDPAIGEMLRTAALRAFASFDAKDGFHWTIRNEGGGSVGQALAPVSRAMLAGAMARVRNSHAQALAPPAPETIAKAIDSAWTSVAEPNRATLLPWIGWASADLATATGEPLAHVDELKQALIALHRARMTASVNGGEGPAADVDGGFALTADDGGTPRPTAQSLRPMVWMARAVRDPRLVGPEMSAAAWTDHLRGMRFVVQLTVSDLQAAMHRDADRTRGGIATSMADSRQPLAAQALGLLTLLETLTAWGPAEAP